MAEYKDIIANRIKSLKGWQAKSTNQATVAAYDREIAALEKEMEKPAPKKKAKKKGDWK
jgi:hypothetical protein